MIGAQTGARGGRIGFMGFVPTVTPANVASSSSSDPDAALARCLALLIEADRDLARLPDDDPAEPAAMAWIDTLLSQAATLRPTTDRGFGVKARIARVYGDLPGGDLVQRWLLSDLMIRGRRA